MTLENVVVCSGGLLVAQRGGHDAALPESSLCVGGTADIVVPGTPPMEARLRDDFVWRRHWVEDERLVIEFVDIAVVEVDAGTGMVTFDRPLAPDLEQHLLFDHILPLVLARRGQLVLHGAVISLDGRGVVMVGDTGAGKSTLTAYAWQHGWTVGNDDGAVLLAGDPPVAEPTYAALRLTQASLDMLGLSGHVVDNVVGKARLAGTGSRAFSRKSVVLQVIAVIEVADAADEATFERLHGISAHAELFGSTFHAEFSRGPQLRAVVDGLASIIEATVVGRLRVPRSYRGLVDAELLLRRLLAAQPAVRAATAPFDGAGK